MQSSDRTIILTIMIIAIILAIGTFLTFSYLQRRPEAPAGTFTTVVEGTEVIVSMDPAQRVRLVDQPAPPNVVEGEGETPTPVPDQAQQDQPLPTNTPPPPTAPPPTATPQDSVIFIDYPVQANDTLYSIAQRLDTSIALMAERGISQDDIVPGETIKLPVGNPEFCPGRRPYAVAEGDTAFRISRAHNVTLADLKAINGLNDDYDIDAAQILCLP